MSIEDMKGVMSGQASLCTIPTAKNFLDRESRAWCLMLDAFSHRITALGR